MLDFDQELMRWLPVVVLAEQHLETKTADYGSMEMIDW